MKNTTISIPDDLQGQLKALARRQHRSESDVIVQALREYLRRHPSEALADEARRQSLKVAELTDEEREWMGA